MTKEVMVAVIDDIKKDLILTLDQSDAKWNAKENPARIVGYLEEAIRMAVRRLDNINK
jgi:hypothetical protein